MSSGGFSELIELRLAETRAMDALCLAMSGVAATAVAVAAIPAGVRVALLAVALAALFGGWHRRRRNPHRLQRAVLQADGTWQLFLASGGPHECRLVRAWGRSGGPVIAIEWRGSSGQRISVWLAAAGLPPAPGRRLRVRLRLA
jgi:hypothetical protein